MNKKSLTHSDLIELVSSLNNSTPDTTDKKFDSIVNKQFHYSTDGYESYIFYEQDIVWSYEDCPRDNVKDVKNHIKKVMSTYFEYDKIFKENVFNN